MSVSNVPAIQWTPAGIVIPQEADVLAGVQEDINSAFGGGLNQALETPQGQLASSEAAVIAAKNSEIAYVTNQVDPNYAQGRFQDALGRIYFLNRNPATATAVTVTLTGLPGTVIPAGTLAQDTSGNIYTISGTIAIGSGGTVSTTFENIVTGPVPCVAGTLTQVYQSIPGWDAITNPADGVLGQNVESAQAFEFRRKNSVAMNAHGSLLSISGAVMGVANVLDAYATENTTNAAILAGATNYSLAPHSLYVAVLGGASADIANAIWSKKDVGCDMNGNTSVTVYDTTYSAPQPSYQITFEIPVAFPIHYQVNIVNNSGLPSNITGLIQSAIVAQFSGTNGGQRERIGGTVYASNYYGPVASAAPNVQINSILVGASINPAGTNVSVGIDQYPSLSAANIAVNLQ